MKVTTDYMVGNTAIQIINTGRKVKVVDVRREKIRKRFMSRLVMVLIMTSLLVTSCFYVVRLHNQKVLLDKQIYSLQSEVEDLEKENVVMVKQSEEEAIDYDDLYEKALDLGMCFPTDGQLETYTVEKSTAVKVLGN